MSRLIGFIVFVLCLCCAFYAGMNTKLLKQLGAEMGLSESEKVDFSSHDHAVGHAHFEHFADGETDLGGIYSCECLEIHWAGSDPLDSRVRPKHVIAATIQRLEAEQQTNLGSNANAKALALMLQALSVLEGKQEQADGFPIIR